MISRKLLVVDDDADVCLGYDILLRQHSFQLYFAEDAALALSVARQELPNLIILDLGLPGDDGFLVLERLAEVPELQSIPVIVVSARAHLRGEERALRAGARAYIQKPWDDDLLLDLIRHFIGDRAIGPRGTETLAPSEPVPTLPPPGLSRGLMPRAPRR